MLRKDFTHGLDHKGIARVQRLIARSFVCYFNYMEESLSSKDFIKKDVANFLKWHATDSFEEEIHIKK